MVLGFLAFPPFMFFQFKGSKKDLDSDLDLIFLCKSTDSKKNICDKIVSVLKAQCSVHDSQMYRVHSACLAGCIKYCTRSYPAHVVA